MNCSQARTICGVTFRSDLIKVNYNGEFDPGSG
jgi:hypothetical protein